MHVATAITIIVFVLSRWTSNIKSQHLLQLLGMSEEVINSFSVDLILLNSKHTKSERSVLSTFLTFEKKIYKEELFFTKKREL